MRRELRVLLSTTEAAERLGIGRAALYDLIRTGRLRTVKIGARRLVPVDALVDVIALLVEETAVWPLPPKTAPPSSS